MEIGIILFTLGAYGLAGWLWWRERTIQYLVALAAGHLGTLPSPVWQVLYQFGYDPRFAAVYRLVERPLPWVILIAGWTLILPPLLIFYLYQRRWWVPSYLSGMFTFGLFVGYQLLIELVGTRAGWWVYAGEAGLPFGVSVTLLSALMNALVMLGLLSLLILTRRYALLSLLLLLLPAPLLLSLLVNGLFGAPLYTVLLLRTVLQISVESWAAAIGLIGTLGLLLAGTHLIATVIADQRRFGTRG